jgi:sugar lactone lactonase YvrE
MAQQQTSRSTTTTATETATDRVFVLDLSGGRIFSMNPDGSGKKTLVTGCRLPDGIVVDADAGHIYWTNMGVPSRNDGSIERADLDGSNRRFIVPEGGVFTPKQMTLDRKNRKLYWCDREGMRVMRANLDGSNIETLVHTSEGDPRPGPDVLKQCVGIVVDVARGHFYWTQKGPENAGLGRIFRAGIEMPTGETAATRRDITVLFDGLPEPIDLEIDEEHRMLYWTDRGDAPKGNTVNRTPLDAQSTPEVVLRHLGEGIGIALDVRHDRMFVTDLAGSVHSARLDGSDAHEIAAGQGNLTGIAYTESV